MGKKIGKIRVSRNIIELNEYKVFKTLFSEVYPIDINWNYRDAEYTCLSPLFEEIEEGEEMPFYEATIREDKLKISKL